MGCPLVVTMDGGDVVSVTGNTCKRGEIYGRKEVTNPTRIVTSTVRVSGGSIDMVSVKTRGQPIGQPIHVNLLSSIVYASSILTVIVSRSGYFKSSAFLNFSSSISPGATTGRFLWITRSSPKYALT